MAFTQTQLDALDAAIASGTLTVEYDGKRLTYQNTDALLKARSAVARALGQAPRSTYYATYSKGL